jgi:hypothetical protein
MPAVFGSRRTRRFGRQHRVLLKTKEAVFVAAYSIQLQAEGLPRPRQKRVLITRNQQVPGHAHQSRGWADAVRGRRRCERALGGTSGRLIWMALAARRVRRPVTM